MATIVLGSLMVCLLLSAGCSTGSQPAGQENSQSASQTTGSFGTGSPFGTAGLGQAVVLTNGSYTLTASIDHIETETLQSGKQRIDIYLKVVNTGDNSVLPVWHTGITGENGIRYGGVGVSHGGAGVEGPLLDPDSQVIARDYITIDSAEDYSALAKGGTLDVTLTGYDANLQPVARFWSTWTYEQGTIR